MENPNTNLKTDSTKNELHPVSAKIAIERLIQGISLEDKKIFSISGAKGIGKSSVLEESIKKLADQNFVWLYGKCTSLTQLTPGGLIHDILLNLFNIPNFCINTPSFIKEAEEYFKGEFPKFKKVEIEILINFLYSFIKNKSTNIVQNKKQTFEVLFKVFKHISSYGKVLIVADNFDYIDGFSYEFITHIFKNETPESDINLILMYCEYTSAKNYIVLSDNTEIYLDIPVATMNNKEIQELYNSQKEKFIYTNEFEKNEILAKSGGNPAFIEQALSYCFECQIADMPFLLPNEFKELINKRLKNLKKINLSAYKLLVSAAILGYKINSPILMNVFFYDGDEISDIFDYLEKMQFIIKKNDEIYEFKSILLWETILSNAKNDEDYIEVNNNLIKVLQNYTINSNTVSGLIAQNTKQYKMALDVWIKNSKSALNIGDINLYVISLKQCLTFINELDEKETLQLRYDIYENLGKILADYNPTEAIDFLPDAISNAKTIQNDAKEIELLGYLANSCLKTGNYYGNIECVDKVLEKINSNKKFTIAMLKTTKLEALLYIGNCGEVINIIDNDIIPALDKYFSKQYKSNLPKQLISQTWTKTYLILAKALILQGNDRYFEILTILFDIIERNKIDDDEFICKSKITLALANTLKGDFKVSEDILNAILDLYKDDAMNDQNILEWNFVKIINNILQHKHNGIQTDMYEVVAFANNCGNELYKNIIKTLLGKVLRDNSQLSQSLDIYNEQITYFAKEKYALCALLTWYFIADVTLDAQGPHEAIDVAQQALEVAQNPKIDNYISIILLKIVLAKAYMVLSDYESAKINLEHALTLAVKFDMKDLLSKIYLLYGKYFQEIGLVKSTKQKDYLCGAKKMFAAAVKECELTQNTYVIKKITEAQNALTTYCKMNYILLDR